MKANEGRENPYNLSFDIRKQINAKFKISFVSFSQFV